MFYQTKHSYWEHWRGGKVHDSDSREGQGSFWTLQQFTTLYGQPWYALHMQSDEGVQWGFTGYRHEITSLCQKCGITPKELPPISEVEYFRRLAGDMPQEPAASRTTTARPTWELT